MTIQNFALPWLQPGDAFPPADQAWNENSDAPGLLAAGGDLSEDTLVRAYSGGIFPWFSDGQPILWWSTDPRMVLKVSDFRIHRSFKKTLTRFANDPRCEVRMDTAFADVIGACSNISRHDQQGTWILPPMVEAYLALHRQGFAHSVETWIDGVLVGGLYCIGIGKSVFGESMFSLVPNASKIALAGLVAFCRDREITAIDCQQKTSHLASLGAKPIAREMFLEHIGRVAGHCAGKWSFSNLYWKHILSA
jgi:leucyl/phenylalanyl-tRNA--protein transferase